MNKIVALSRDRMGLFVRMLNLINAYVRECWDLSNTTLFRIGQIPASRWRIVAILSILYVLNHGSGLFRELSLEEGIFIQPGFNLLSGRGFYWSWGELDAQVSPFHKPPLLSFLAGGLAWLTGTVDFGPKLLPFFIGGWIVLMPYVATGSWLASLLLLASPFFIAASGQVQTEPTVCLLGYGLVVLGLGGILKQQLLSARWPAVWSAGLIILWLGKVETAMIATFVSGCAVLIMPPAFRRLGIVWLTVSTAAGVGLLCVVTGMLGQSTGMKWQESIGEIFFTITRIVGETVGGEGAKNGRWFLCGLLIDYQVPQLAGLLLLPVLWAWRSLQRLHVFYLLAAAVPMFAYLGVAYVGDGFPRYFLIMFPSLALLAAEAYTRLDRWRAFLVTVLTVAGTAILLVPPAGRMLGSKASPVIRMETHGYRESARMLTELTTPGDMLVIPEPCFLYLADRRLLVIESFAPYPERSMKVLGRRGEVRGMIVHRAELREGETGIMSRLVAELTAHPYTKLFCGSFVVFARTD